MELAIWIVRYVQDVVNAYDDGIICRPTLHINDGNSTRGEIEHLAVIHAHRARDELLA
jgi:hypothetical protein